MRQEELRVLPDLVQEYLTYMEVTKGLSGLTILEYGSDLRTFFRFLSVYKGLVPSSAQWEQIDLTGIDLTFIRRITVDDAYRYLIYCKNERKNNEKTRARKVISIRRFFTYLTDKKGLLEQNPMKVLEMPKTKKALPKYLSLEESLALLSSVDGPYKERDYCILTLFLNCGLRLSELVSINYMDISTDRSLTILGKGNKERKVYLNDACMQAIEEYRRVRPVEGVKKEHKKALFLSSRLSRISPKTVQHLVNVYLEKAGLGGRGLSVHKLRHTAATLMYQHGNVDLLVLKDILGHENVGTTEIYTHLSNAQSRAAIENNPLAAVKRKPPSTKV